MKINSLVKHLEKLQKEHGNVEVLINGQYGFTNQIVAKKEHVDFSTGHPHGPKEAVNNHIHIGGYED